ncbi:MAG: hypothetical protein ACW98F_05625 [Candidatus Hodarchaeales archaeon]|jgi:hypothetical protein
MESSDQPETGTIQCPCGREIKDTAEYKLLFLKKEMNEIDILCPNDSCYLRELGFIIFKKIDEDDKKQIKFDRAEFYVPFVTWNATRLSEKQAEITLKEQLTDIVKNKIDWKSLVT